MDMIIMWLVDDPAMSVDIQNVHNKQISQSVYLDNQLLGDSATMTDRDGENQTN